MGLFTSMDINRVAGYILIKFRTLETLINSNGGVNEKKLNIVITTIDAIERDLSEINSLMRGMSFNKQCRIQLKWSDGRAYPLIRWIGLVNWSNGEAKLIVNKFRKVYS